MASHRLSGSIGPPCSCTTSGGGGGGGGKTAGAARGGIGGVGDGVGV